MRFFTGQYDRSIDDKNRVQLPSQLRSAIDPERAAEIAFTAPYVVIEGTYLVPADSPLRTIEDVDRDGVRVADSEIAEIAS